MTTTDAKTSRMLNIPETSQEINRSPSTLRYWIATGTELGPMFRKYGRRRMIERSALEAWIESKACA